MDLSENGIRFIERQEGLELAPYWDADGLVWTDGYGNTTGVIPNGPAITQERAEADLRRNIGWAQAAVNTLVKVPITQDQDDALVDFVFNLGATNFGGSTLLRLLNAGDYEGAAGQFGRWIHDATGAVNSDLVDRRAREAAMFQSGFANPSAPAKAN